MKLRDLPLQLPDPSEDYFPGYALPKPAANAHAEGVRNIKAPAPLIFASMLASLSIACMGKTIVERPNGMRSPCVVNPLTLGTSGERKSAADRVFAKPVKIFQEQHEERYTKRLHSHLLEMDRWETKKQDLEHELKRARKKELPTDELESELEKLSLATPVRPKGYKLISEDVTPQGFLKMLHEHHPVGGIFSSEGGTVLDAQTLRNLGIFNKLWDGDPIHVERASRESFVIRDGRVMVALMVQPGILMESILKNGNAFREIGFAARALMSYPASNKGLRPMDGLPPEWTACEQYNDRITQLLKRNYPEDPESSEDIVLTFCAEGKQAWIADFNMVEREMGPNGYYADVSDAASKYSENVARVAALFHCLESDEHVIGIDSVRSAISVCRWYLDQFKHIFGVKPLPPQELMDANALGVWLDGRCRLFNGPMAVPRNHILQYGPPDLRNKGRCHAALDMLINRGQIEIRRIKKTAWVLLNPHVFPVAPDANGWVHWPVPPGFFLGEQ